MFALNGGFSAVALDVHFKNGGVVHEAVDSRQRHRLIGEDLSPFTEGLVCGDQHRAAFVTGGDPAIDFRDHQARTMPWPLPYSSTMSAHSHSRSSW